MPATGTLLASIAPRRLVQTGFVLVAGMLPVITLAGSAWQLFVVLAGWGVGIGMVDVGVNTEGSRVQDRLGRRVMSRFHGAYSVGGLVGAGLGAAAATMDISARVNFTVAAAVVAIGGIGAAHAFASKPTLTVASDPTVHSRRPQWSWTLVALAAMAFGSFLAEGAANDWSAVYLHSALRAPVGLAAVTYTVFSATMAAGRLVGDRLADRAGPVHLIRYSAGMAGFSFAAALIVGRVWAGLAGFAILGAGLSFIVPLVFTTASRLGRTGPNLAFVTSCGYMGMLVGPGLIGGLAEAVGLPQALGVIVAFSFMAVILAGVTRPKPSVTMSSPLPTAEVGIR
jgi:predicted MFS family arabinose efflux permease